MISNIPKVTINSVITNDNHTPFIFHIKLNIKTMGIIRNKPLDIDTTKALLGLFIQLKYIDSNIFIPAKKNPIK